MTSAPSLSVIIPHLNEPDDLARCLRSLDAQRGDNIAFEIIVVDNGSPQLPEAVCAAFADVRLERETTPGPGPARNLGAKLARADLLAFIDADCIAAPGWVRAIVTFMDKHPDIGFLGGDIAILPTDPARLTAVEAYESIYSYRASEYVTRHGFAATGNMAVRANVFQSVGPFGGIATMEDTEWGQRATARGFRIAFLPEAKIFTASCKSFGELARRWDRHVAHEFRKVKGHPVSIFRWILTSAILAASPPAELPSILRSRKISGTRTRWLALLCLSRIRFYRARQMLSLAWKDNSSTMVKTWNRENS